MTQFITLAGRKQVGKDTSANMLAEMLAPAYVDGIYVVHFADALKKACNVIFGIPLEDMETEEGKQKFTDIQWPWRETEKHAWIKVVYKDWPQLKRFMTIREVLQFVGTELFRTQMDPNVWVKSIYRRPWEEGDIVIVADCRFPNEAEFAKEHGLLISVERDTELGSDGHASETALDSYDDYHYTIDNNGSFDDLREKLAVILKASNLLI